MMFYSLCPLLEKLFKLQIQTVLLKMTVFLPCLHWGNNHSWNGSLHRKKILNNTLMERPNFLAVGGIRMCKQTNLLDIKWFQSFKAAGVWGRGFLVSKRTVFQTKKIGKGWLLFTLISLLNRQTLQISNYSPRLKTHFKAVCDHTLISVYLV